MATVVFVKKSSPYEHHSFYCSRRLGCTYNACLVNINQGLLVGHIEIETAVVPPFAFLQDVTCPQTLELDHICLYIAERVSGTLHLSFPTRCLGSVCIEYRPLVLYA